MKLIEKERMVPIRVVEITIDKQNDYEEYLKNDGDEDNILFWLDEKFTDLGCSGNHNTWHGWVDELGEAKFELVSDYNGRKWMLEVVIDKSLLSNKEA